jgi:hypothetical protein
MSCRFLSFTQRNTCGQGPQQLLIVVLSCPQPSEIVLAPPPGLFELFEEAWRTCLVVALLGGDRFVTGVRR